MLEDPQNASEMLQQSSRILKDSLPGLSRSPWPEWLPLLLFSHAFAATMLKDFEGFSAGPLSKTLARMGPPVAIYSCFCCNNLQGF